MHNGENLTLDRSIAQFKSSPTAQNAMLMRHMLAVSLYYAALKPNIQASPAFENPADSAASLLDLESSPFALQKGEPSMGQMLFLYTSKDALEKENPGCQAAVLNFSGLLTVLAKFKKSFQTLVINPNGEAIAFTVSQFLQAFEAGLFTETEEVVEKGSLLVFENASHDAPGALLRQLRKGCRQNVSIQKAWLARQMDNDSMTRWVVVIEDSAGNEDSCKKLARLIIPFAQRKPVALCLSDNEMAKDIIHSFAPVYIRK